MKYSTDALDDTLYEAGEPVLPKNKAIAKTKVENANRLNLKSMSPSEISDLIYSYIKKSKKNGLLSEVENLHAPLDSLGSYDNGDSTNLVGCIKSNVENLLETERDNNLRILVISNSAIRATELIRQLGPLRQDLGVGKCFAKHFKIEDQLKFFDSNCPLICVGTPNRLSKLFSSGHKYFNMDSVQLCIIDTHRDLKQRNIFEIPETCSDLLDFYISNILPSLKTSKSKLIFF